MAECHARVKYGNDYTKTDIMTQSLKGPIKFGFYRISLELDTYVSDSKKCDQVVRRFHTYPFNYCILEIPRTRNITTLVTSSLCFFFVVTIKLNSWNVKICSTKINRHIFCCNDGGTTYSCSEKLHNHVWKIINKKVWKN